MWPSSSGEPSSNTGCPAPFPVQGSTGIFGPDFQKSSASVRPLPVTYQWQQAKATAEDSEKTFKYRAALLPLPKTTNHGFGEEPQAWPLCLQHVMVVAVQELGRLLAPSDICWEMSRAGGSYISFANLPLLQVWGPFSRLQSQTQEELFDSLSSDPVAAQKPPCGQAGGAQLGLLQGRVRRYQCSLEPAEALFTLKSK